jgi:hypothetical protein
MKGKRLLLPSEQGFEKIRPQAESLVGAYGEEGMKPRQVTRLWRYQAGGAYYA